jgi:hypothetical protein
MLRTIESGPRISENDIAQFERQYRVTLPEPYRLFLLERNGGRPERDVFDVPGSEINPVVRLHFFFGIDDPEESCNLAWNLDEYADRIPSGLMPIATTEGADKICLELRGEARGRILFWDGYEEDGEKKLLPVAPTFEAFVNQLRRDENSPEMGP